MPLQLGDVEFAIDELPESVPFGVSQALAVRRYPGSTLDIQSLGSFAKPIRWKGTLQFANAMARATALNEMLEQAKAVMLQCSTISVPVVVSIFDFDYHNDFWIPYEIEVQPAARLTMSGRQGPAPLRPFTTTPVAPPAVGTAPQVALSPVALANPSTPKPTYNIAGLFGLGARTPLGTIINQMAPAGVAQTLSTVRQVVHLVKAGETLWHIANRHYGNGNLWTQIAALNNILTPTVAVGQKLIIPQPTEKTTR